MKKKSILLLLTFVFCLTIVLTGCATENTDSSVQSTENETMATSSTTKHNKDKLILEMFVGVMI